MALSSGMLSLGLQEWVLSGRSWSAIVMAPIGGCGVVGVGLPLQLLQQVRLWCWFGGGSSVAKVGEVVGLLDQLALRQNGAWGMVVHGVSLRCWLVCCSLVIDRMPP